MGFRFRGPAMCRSYSYKLNCDTAPLSQSVPSRVGRIEGRNDFGILEIS